ncbi:MAG: Foldase protein PrsA [Microgenomates group bacterium GW2011_GWC2_45_8]|nr:MAG: Foldase protein PrsA [Microgenomates group bacterium GW2011_GWC2_45_8]
MPKKAKVRKVTKKEIIETPITTSSPVGSPVQKSMNPKILRGALIIILIALLTYKLGPWLVPTIVDNKLVTRFSLWSRLEKTYGTQTLDDLVNEKILDAAIAKAGIKIEQKKIDEQIAKLETQFKDAGGLDEALKQRGLTRPDLVKQVKTQLEVEELLSDKITLTDAEIQKEFSDNEKTLYTGKKLEEVSESIQTQLKDAKLRDAFLAWFAEVKKTAKVKSFGL